jgi:mono/diheme cytochrome c family protein
MRAPSIAAVLLSLGAIAAPALAAQPASAPAAAAATASGESVYKHWCVHCHSAGRGNPGTDSLKVKYKDAIPAVLLDRTDMTPQFVSTAVRQGVLSMPPFRKTEITDAELTALATWVASGGGKR